MQRSTGILAMLAFAAGALLTALALEPDLRRKFAVPGAVATSGLYAERDWDRSTPSKLNISVFAFGDRNRNGRYDVGDKPLNRIAVRLRRADGSTRIGRSNVNGYANFSMLEGGSDADITVAGEPYRFQVLAPEGWTVTTDNARQDVLFKNVPGSVAGIAAANPPAVVGLAPPLTVSGQWPEYAESDGSLRLIDADGGQVPVRPDRDGNFELEVKPGQWHLADFPSNARWSEFPVAYAPVRLASQPLHPTAPRRQAWPMVTVTFDDLQRSFIEKVAAGYAGLDWDYLLAVDNQFYKGPGYINGLMSGANVAYNSSGHPVTVRALEPGGRFDFVGGYFSVAWHNAEGETLAIRAWREDTQVAEEQLRLSHLAPVYLHAEYNDITRLELETLHYWQFVADDLSFRVPAPRDE